MNQNKWLLLIWVLGLLLRVPDISRVPLDTHHIRQSDTSAIIRNMQRGGIDLLHPRIDWGGPKPVTVESELPLYNAMAAVVLQDTPIQSPEGFRRTRLFSLMIWSAMVWVTVAWIRRWWPHLTFVAMIVLVFSPLSVVFSQTIQPDMLALTLLMVATVRICAFSESDAPYAKLSLIVGLCAFSLSGMVKGTMLFVLPLFGHMLMKSSGSWRASLIRLSGLCVATAISLGWYYYAHRTLGASGATFGIWSVDGEKWGTWTVLSSGQTWKSLVEAMVYCLFTPLGVVLAGIGMVKAIRHRDTMLLIPILGGLIGVILTADGFRHHEYYWLYFLPWASVGVAMGVKDLRDWLKSQPSFLKSLAAVTVFALFYWSMVTSAAYVQESRKPDDRVLEMAKIVSDRVPSHAHWLLVDRYAQSILFHANRRAWRLNQLDSAVVMDRVEDGLEYLVVLDRIPSESDTEPLEMLKKMGVSTALDNDGWLIDFNPTSTGAP